MRSTLYWKSNGKLNNGILDEVNTSIAKEDLVSVSIDADIVLRAINQLKPRKSDGKSLISDHVLFAPPSLAA